MPVETVARSEAGPQRDTNEDAVLVARCAGWHLVAVADGMGGPAAGDTASETAVDALGEAVAAELDLGAPPDEALTTAIAVADDRLETLAAAHGEYEGFGTTIVAALVHPGRAVVVNVGDSPAYRFAGADLELVTEDHTVAQRLVRAGELRPAEAQLHPKRGVLTRAVGPATDATDPAVTEVELDGTLVLCSDGITDTLTEDRITSALQETLAEPGPGTDAAPGTRSTDGGATAVQAAAAPAAEAVLERARMAGAGDNLSVAIARVV